MQMPAPKATAALMIVSDVLADRDMSRNPPVKVGNKATIVNTAPTTARPPATSNGLPNRD
jgi:hypothetical protein